MGPLGGGAGFGGGVEYWKQAESEIRIRCREVGEGLESVDFDDDAPVIEIAEEDVDGECAFGGSEFEAGK